MTTRRTSTATLVLACIAVACGGTSADDSQSAGGVGGIPTASGPDTDPTATATTDETTSATGGTTTANTTSTPTASATGSSDSTQSSEGGEVFDVNTPDVGACSGTGGNSLDFSYIWVANSAESGRTM